MGTDILGADSHMSAPIAARRSSRSARAGPRNEPHLDWQERCGELAGAPWNWSCSCPTLWPPIAARSGQKENPQAAPATKGAGHSAAMTYTMRLMQNLDHYYQ
jgi:hypothetical protein